ncbi:hypothetical protein CAAN1_16S00870 [[Candida] anglica]|uniref:Uncharacterized protein n=1 Tax=[Candida] anglica TaxID=148631 RepID=A0ABP0EAB6_9ASCO
MSTAHLKTQYPVPVPRNPLPIKNFKATHSKQFEIERASQDSLPGEYMSSTSLSTNSSRAESSTNIFGDDSSENVDTHRSQTPATPSTSNNSDTSLPTPSTPPPRIIVPKAHTPSYRSPIPIVFGSPLGMTTRRPTVASAHTPPPPPSSVQHIQPFFETAQDDYLQFLEPNPVAPPEYESLPPGGCPKYPIMGPIETSASSFQSETLPDYTPTIYKIGMVSRKCEWLSPYEPSTTRSWRNMVMELNSTQLNFYSIPSNLEAHLSHFRGSGSQGEVPYTDMDNFNSTLTDNEDIEFYKMCQRVGIIPSDGTDNASNQSGSNIRRNSSSTSISSRGNIKNNKFLVRTYTLQHARIGLATDYKKRSNVLRIRVESEQILIDFGVTKTLIDWNLALGIGKDVSLDISERELPRYRTVPRRRRNRNRNRRNTTSNDTNSRETFLSTSGTNGRRRAQSDANLSYGQNSIKGRLFRMKSKLSLSGMTDSSNNNSNILPVRAMQPTFSVDDEDDDEEEEVDEVGGTGGEDEGAYSGADSLDDEGQVRFLHQSEGDEEEEDDEDADEYDPEILQENDRNDRQTRHYRPSISHLEDFKWDPCRDNTTSEAKLFRNCLRCIKPLTAEDLWIGKVLVKPTTLSPLNMSYLRNVKYGSGIPSNSSSTTSLASLSSTNNYTTTLGSGTSFRKRSFSIKDIPHMPDTTLPKVPNHFVKEYTVGSHGLIPKLI